MRLELDLPARSLSDWKQHLSEDEMLILFGEYDYDLDDELTPGEVLEILVDFNGGVVTGYQIKDLIARIYGVEL